MENAESIAAKIESRVRKIASIGDGDEFSRKINLFEYGYLDSFAAVELLGFVESTFGVTIPDEDLATRPLNSVDEMVAYVIERIGSCDN